MKKPINVEVADYKKLNAIRLKLTNQDPKARVVTFAEVIHQLLLEAGEWSMEFEIYVLIFIGWVLGIITYLWVLHKMDGLMHYES